MSSSLPVKLRRLLRRRHTIVDHGVDEDEVERAKALRTLPCLLQRQRLYPYQRQWQPPRARNLLVEPHGQSP